MRDITQKLLAFLVGMAVSDAQAQTSATMLLEMKTLADAVTFASFDTTYYVSLENLNDLPGTTAIPDYNSIQHLSGVYVIRPWEGRFKPNRENLATAFNDWAGPYVNFQQGTTQTGPDPYDVGSPLDPWGNPYLIFSPLGLLRGDNGQVTVEYYADQFDQYTIVSLGPDGIPNSNDFFYTFGETVQSVALSSLKGPTVQLISPPKVSPVYQVDAGSTVTVRGLNLGSTQGNAVLRFSGMPITKILSWSSREIQFVVPEAFSGVGSLTVDRITTLTNLLPVTIMSPDSTVNTWVIY